MHYITISTGRYDDFTSRYFVGEQQVSQFDLNAQATVTRLAINRWYESLPKRMKEIRKPSVGYILTEDDFEKYDPLTGNTVYEYMLEDRWVTEMTGWLNRCGYSALPEALDVHYDNG